MKSLRSKVGNALFKYAAFVYDSHNPLRQSLGNMLFGLAASVSPNKK